jgi:acetyl-CoA carboxylase/biotin carboxylase 1
MDSIRSASKCDLDKKSLLASFSKSLGGARPIQHILIANNGMAATKCILSLRNWAFINFGDEKALKFMAMATRDDLNANAEFIRLADAYVEVPSGSNRNNYANVDLIIDIATTHKVDAVWPGWGHASENPALPAGLAAKGIQFIGPTSSVMAALGDKISAGILAQTAGVPSIPWSGDGITSKLNDEGVIPQEDFMAACVTTADEAEKRAKKIGYPVMIKASEGGGGKGIRKATNDEELRTQFTQVQNEVVGSPIFLMQLCTGARHLEVQIVGDEHGNALALNGRDCSTQRRFQKIFEEGPPIIAPKEVFTEMELAAQRLTQSIGYIGAGTVEYLFSPKDHKFYFLELNPRLQVEHPVTEGLTGCNVPSIQLQVAMGIPLYCIPEVRKFWGKDPAAKNPIDFMKERYVYPSNHVIAARITAENPDEGFKPTSGAIERVKFQSRPNLWGYFSIGANAGIHEFADSQFGHLFASGPTREDARKALVHGLKQMEVRGDIRTPIEYLTELLETKEFKENNIDTSWLDGILSAKSVQVAMDDHTVAVGAAIFKAHSMVHSQKKELLDALAKGQTSLMGIPAMLKFPIEVTISDIKYSFQGKMLGENRYELSINGQVFVTSVREQPDQSLLCSVNGQSYQLFGQEEALGLRMRINGTTIMIPTVYNPSELRSDVTGKIVRFLQQDGEMVGKGEAFVEVEAMKMIMAIKAGEAGIITHNMAAGSVIAPGDLMGSLQLTDLSKVKQIGTFTERLRVVKPCPELDADAALEVLKLAILGYENDVATALTKLVQVMEPQAAVVALKELVQSFVDMELPFQGSNDDDIIIGGLAKSNKDSLATLVPTLVAHKQVRYRIQRVLDKVLSEMASLVATLMDQQDQSWLLSMVEGGGLDEIKEGLMATLQAVLKLQGKVYGEAQLKTNHLLESLSMPSFKDRLNKLASQLKNGSTDLEALSKEPILSVSVNLLTVLMSHSEEIVRKAAMEVYIRRVHRADLTTSMTIKESNGVLTATWDFTIRPTQGMAQKQRHGFAAMLPDFASLDSSMPQIIQTAAAEMPKSEPTANVLYIGFSKGPADEKVAAASISQILQSNKAALDAMNLRNANVFIAHPGGDPTYFNFYASIGYQEDLNCRNMRPNLPLLLELSRLADAYELTRMSAVGRNSQLYLASEKAGDKKRGGGLQVLFLRSVSHMTEDIVGAENAILLAFDELDRARLDPRVQPTTSSRFFLNILPHDRTGVDKIGDIWQSTMEGLISKHASRLLELNVDEIEVKVRVKEGDDIVPVRLVASSSSGGWMQPSAYREFHDPITGVTQQYCNLIGDAPDRMILGNYSGSSPIQTKRVAARRAGSTYAHDFLGLLDVALITTWQKHLETAKWRVLPKRLLVSQELVLDKEGNMVATDRMPGENKIGMLAWCCTIKTPQYPDGRDVIIIANDVTVQSGSFGVLEDDFFYKASEYARDRGLPRIFISCNSGARIGLVEDLKPKFQVQWKDKSNPSLGYEYLYLSENDYKSLPEGTVKAEAKVVGGETQYVLSAIIGQIHGIGVENLRGSGMIAGETSRAYDETFTLSYVTGRSVGIGAYLNRLGQRVIQMQQGPMILTGSSALNKLLGKEVYTSQDQLGGPQIMYPNGISHQVVENDREGMVAVLDWINYTPKDFNSLQPIPDGAEDPSRPIEFIPTKTPYDPRHMLAGTTSSDGSFVTGFLDKDSFKEYMGGWGKSVVAGRGRLGGINVGVIAVETRLVEQRIPADPGNSESREDVKPQAGQVWYPDSAYKTAQAIEDFNRGENLPLLIFANWRGFSGGTRDMYGEILKFGSMIVDALRTYKHPVFVYIPPNGELRGGAWVVVDPTINPAKMEMYADTEARGGILEPPGICEVKYRKPDQIAAAHRMDPVLKELDDDLGNCSDPAERERITSDIADRENLLAPVYLNVAHEFADLHDRAGRMKAKNCIRDELQWKSSRSFFYWRIRRRISEDAFKDRLIQASGGAMPLSEANEKVLATLGSEMDDQAAAAWYESNADAMDAAVKAVRMASTASTVSKLLAGLSDADRQTILRQVASGSADGKSGYPGVAMGA